MRALVSLTAVSHTLRCEGRQHGTKTSHPHRCCCDRHSERGARPLRDRCLVGGGRKGALAFAAGDDARRPAAATVHTETASWVRVCSTGSFVHTTSDHPPDHVSVCSASASASKHIEHVCWLLCLASHQPFARRPEPMASARQGALGGKHALSRNSIAVVRNHSALVCRRR